MARYRSDMPPANRSVLRKNFRLAPQVIDNGHVVEKLRHCRFPKSRHQFVKATT